MKKIVSILLVLAMMAALCITVAAASLTDGVNGGTTGNVSVQVKDNAGTTDPSKVYKVDLTWTNLTTFVFNGTWDAEQGKYTGTWANSEGYIAVSNSSNAKVHVSATIDKTQANGVTASLTHTEFDLSSAADASTTAVTSGNINVAVEGTPEADSFTIGIITVAISTID